MAELKRQSQGHTAFFYGTLMSPPILYRVLFLTSHPSPNLTRNLTISPAILPNYCRHRVRDADYPGVVPEEGKSVRGTYVTGLTKRNISNLDVFEGGEYERRKVKVRVLKESSGALHEEGRDGQAGKEGTTNGVSNGDGQEDYEDGEQVETETYVFLHPEGLERVEWDFEEFVREKAHRWVFCDEEYAEVDQAQSEKRKETNGRDPTGGRGWAGDMDRKLTPQEDDEEVEERLDEEEALRSAV